MLQLLNDRESGVGDPRSLLKAHRTARSHLIELSKYRDVQQNHTAGINSLQLDQVERRYLLSGGADGQISIFDIDHTSPTPEKTYKSIKNVKRGHRFAHTKSVSRVSWYPIDTGMFVTSGTDKCLKIWDTNQMKPAEKLDLDWLIYSHDMSPTSVLHSLVAVSGQHSKIVLVDLRTGSKTHTLKGHNGRVYCVRWSPKDDFILASGSEDNRVMFWDVRKSKGHIMVLDQHNGDSSATPQSVNTAHSGHVNGLEFTADGLHLVTTGTDHRLRLWETGGGKNLLVNYGKIQNDSKKCIQFAISEFCDPDLIYIPQNADIEVFNMISGEHVQTLTGHFNQVNCLVYNGDYQELYSGANDRNILVFSPNTEMEAVYKDHVDSMRKAQSGRAVSGYVKRIGTADAWSSDED
ncbi:DNA excision repair protein ERCC-8-like [Lineus longissimus]|uniref:DNA excision repair protein ERCC-8-like n=1 Tax=Lineus longissimus TaxID=88925 RepID=UPI00315CC598